MFITDFEEKKVKRLVKLINRTKITNSPKVLICANFIPENSNFAICTAEGVTYVISKMGTFTRVSQYNYSSISSAVQEDQGIGKAFVKLTIGGGDIVLLEVMCNREDSVAFVDYIRTKLGNKAPVTSDADELKKFKDLLDVGAITQDEYDRKKRQLLGL